MSGKEYLVLSPPSPSFLVMLLVLIATVGKSSLRIVPVTVFFSLSVTPSVTLSVIAKVSSSSTFSSFLIVSVISFDDSPFLNTSLPFNLSS